MTRYIPPEVLKAAEEAFWKRAGDADSALRVEDLINAALDAWVACEMAREASARPGVHGGHWVSDGSTWHEEGKTVNFPVLIIRTEAP